MDFGGTNMSIFFLQTNWAIPSPSFGWSGSISDETPAALDLGMPSFQLN
jgi:hypothetical protein